ncbi:MAG: hypothetical protein KGI43_02650 [Alphaproteobacteria bacterium]|nr:hypothetical protein [Alphaproteobacteria bacterium]
MQINWSNSRDVAIAFLALLALAIPFLPIPGDHEIRMYVRYHTHGTAPRAFSTYTLHSICTVMATALAYNDPKTGQYTRISCGR